ncbi:cas scaffolding protein family member 4 [Elgaria multicarinata webbii]|uniref:cas scaffolding protein family member 4 n=1 Tax=Elgaria multicarinata webbii TaxID=159646 RepID=UPI002FCCE07F
MNRNIGPSMLTKNTLAKALYDNKAECPDELAFRRGDILTVLEQNLLGSEGWWNCSLHGKQGLAPANRLQLLTPLQTPSTQHDSQGLPTSPRIIYQVPSAHGSPASLPVYEKMDGWTTPASSSSSASLPPTQEVYQVPALAAKLLSEKTQRSSNQHLFTLPRATWASALGSRCDIYDVPSPQHRVSLFTQGLATPPSSRKGSSPFPSTERCLEKLQQLYDIPLSLEKARGRTWQECLLDNVYVTPSTAGEEPVSGSQGKPSGHFNTLPNLRKSEWIYDIPVSPEKAGLKQTSQKHSANKQVLYDIPPPRFDCGMQKIPSLNNESKSVSPEIYDVPPIQRKLTFPEIPLYDVPSTHDVLVQRQNGNYDVPSATMSSRTEKEKFQQTLYDIPKAMSVAMLQKKENADSYNPGDSTYIFPPQLSTDGKLDQDRLSVSSVDSRTSTISTLSSSSTESFSSTASSSSTPSSSLEERTKETTMELELAKETLTKLQHSVSSSVASLMIFVSSRWRYQEHLEGNIEEIHRAVDHIKVSLEEFLDFARTIEGNASRSSDSKLQERIKKQLNILTDSFQILVETRDALNNCKWSLEVLVIKKPQSNPDDLDRFVMVARTIPDDIKRFASIIIANGKLLFRKNCKEKDGEVWRVGIEHKKVTCHVEQEREEDSHPRNILNKPKENSPYSEKARADVTKDCDHIEGSLPAMKHSFLSKQDSAERMELPSICRLYFGAVQKAIDVLHKSLATNEAPEDFIAKSKLIIMVGQRLVDALCQEALKKPNRNEVLCGSSNFCGLLKSLAVATKNAAMQYPSPKAMKGLLDQADGLSMYLQQFRAMVE